jgi:uncharacterized protein YjbI with pentapeptide repeats
MRLPDSKYAFYFNLLDQGVLAWNTWRAQHPDKIINLEGARLDYRDLREINFSRMNLENTRFQGTDFRHADFTCSRLCYANIKRCALDHARFSGVESSFMIIKDSPLDLVVDSEGLRHALSSGSRTSILHA